MYFFGVHALAQAVPPFRRCTGLAAAGPSRLITVPRPPQLESTRIPALQGVQATHTAAPCWHQYPCTDAAASCSSCFVSARPSGVNRVWIAVSTSLQGRAHQAGAAVARRSRHSVWPCPTRHVQLQQGLLGAGCGSPACSCGGTTRLYITTMNSARLALSSTVRCCLWLDSCRNASMLSTYTCARHCGGGGAVA
jgi:hypothetical protein